MSLDVQVKEVNAVRIVFSRFVTNMQRCGEDMGKAYDEVWKWMESQGVGCCCGYAIAVYPDPEFNPDRITVEAGFPCAEDLPVNENFLTRTVPGGVMARVLHVGPYEEIGKVYEGLMGWIAQNGKRINGPCQERYLNDPAKVPPQELQTEILIPVA